MSGGDVLSYRETVKVVKDFLETAFHTLLYLRQLYPPEIFHKRQEYGVPVWQSRNPHLNQYLGRIVEAVGEELSKGTLSKVVFVIKEANIRETPLERYIFDVKWLIPKEAIPTFVGADFTPRENGLLKSKVEDNLRAFLLKLNAVDSYIMSLPPDITFGVIIELVENSPPPESVQAQKEQVPVEWVPAEERNVSGGREEDDRSSIAPLKSTALGLLNLELVVEELQGKFDLVGSNSEPSYGNNDKGKGRAV